MYVEYVPKNWEKMTWVDQHVLFKLTMKDKQQS